MYVFRCMAAVPINLYDVPMYVHIYYVLYVIV